MKFLIVGLCALLSIATARQNTLERAQESRQRRADMQAARQLYGRDTTASNLTSLYRFLNNATKPYRVESLPNVSFEIGEMYGGQIPVNKSDPSRQMFFMFQPTIGKPVEEITIWFNGGPGCSSLEGFFQENGLFQWSLGQYSPIIQPYSWVTLTNVLWVEYPIGVGFSTGNVTANSEEETARDFVGFFKNFQETFGIKNYKIYVTGESYAGRYVPYVSAALLDQNDTSCCNVSGALMYDPVIGQYERIGQTVVAYPMVEANKNLFNLNSTFMADLKENHEVCGYANYTDTYLTFPPAGVQPAIYTGYNNLTNADCDVWTNAYNAAFQPNPCFDVYEISATCPLLSDPLGYPTDLLFQYDGMGGVYFNRSDVKAAVHAPQDVNWAECTGPVFVGKGGQYGNGDYSADPIQAVLPRVIEATNRVLIANGDFDYEIITNGTLLSIQNMTWNGVLGFQSAPNTSIVIDLPDIQYQAVFESSGLGGLDAPGQGVMGVQHYERGLMWAETFQCGHMQPQFQPRVSYRHLQWLLGRVDTL